MQTHTHDSIVFDIEGTLWNATHTSAQAWTQAIESLGGDRKLTAKELETVSGLTFADSTRTLLPGIAEKDILTVLTVLNQYEKAAIESVGGVFYKGVREGLQNLSQNYKLFLVGNCQEWYLNTFMNHVGHTEAKPIFTDWECYGRTGLSKAENLKLLVTRNELKNPAFVGDTVLDSMAAGLASLPFFFAAYGFGAVLAKNKFDSFQEISDFFLSQVSPMASSKARENSASI